MDVQNLLASILPAAAIAAFTLLVKIPAMQKQLDDTTKALRILKERTEKIDNNGIRRDAEYEQLKELLAKVERRTDEQEKLLSEIKSDLSGIKTTLDFIKQSLDRRA